VCREKETLNVVATAHSAPTRATGVDTFQSIDVTVGFAGCRYFQNIVYYDLATKQIKINTHARFDEGMNDLATLRPNAEYL
jgi:hypothetical protein